MKEEKAAQGHFPLMMSLLDLPAHLLCTRKDNVGFVWEHLVLFERQPLPQLWCVLLLFCWGHREKSAPEICYHLAL